jgi:hypothetical protein
MRPVGREKPLPPLAAASTGAKERVAGGYSGGLLSLHEFAQAPWQMETGGDASAGRSAVNLSRPPQNIAAPGCATPQRRHDLIITSKAPEPMQGPNRTIRLSLKKGSYLDDSGQ